MVNIYDFDTEFVAPADDEYNALECCKCSGEGLYIMDYEHENISDDCRVQFIACPRCGARMVRFVSISRNGDE